jgi:hypothetical protein
VITLLKQKLTKLLEHIDARFNKLEGKIDQLIQKGLTAMTNPFRMMKQETSYAAMMKKVASKKAVKK